MKQFVEVVARFDSAGRMEPQKIIWEDGRTFPIDCVLDVRRAASLKAGGQGTRYTCRICGKRRYLFYDPPQWFVEGREEGARQTSALNGTNQTVKSL